MDQKYACIDIGLKRIGCAISVGLGVVTAQPPILRKNRNQASLDVDKFLDYWDIDILVVGYPKSSIQMQKRIDHFVSLLKFNKKIVFENENLSTQEAKDTTKGVFRHKKDGKIDSIAALIILQRYLDKI